MIARFPQRALGVLLQPRTLLALCLAYGGGLWMVLLHKLEGDVEHGEPGLLAHVLRDATLVVPAAVVAVLAASAVTRRLLAGRSVSPRVARAVFAAISAYFVSTALGLGTPVHGLLFGSHHEQSLGLLPHVMRDGSAAFVVVLPLAYALVELAAAAGRRRWTVPTLSPVPTRRLLQGVALAATLAPVVVLAQATSDRVQAAGTAPAPCAPSSEIKHFDVHAIDVDIPLNRFGDHDPSGKMYVLADRVDDVRRQEASRHVTRGLRGDAIQPLVIRANMGDCVEITLTNNASGGEYGVHLDGFPYEIASSGDAVGANVSSSVARGESRTYRFWIPRDPAVEGTHYMRPGPGARDAVVHGLFGALAVEPPGSRYLSMENGEPIESGWNATIVPGDGKKAFREYALLFHEIGDEDFDIPGADGAPLPRVDPHTSAYRPGSRAINYRSEPFMHRLDRAPQHDSLGYSSYPFGDPATPLPRGYAADPTKIRIVHGGSEMFHVFHLHGGGDRWRQNPAADKTFDYTDTGLNKKPKVQDSPSSRLDSQSIGPGEAYNLEIEGGAGGVQQGAGEFLFHCHIGEHYVGGMWSFWRVYDTRKPDLEPLPDRAPPPTAVDSAGLIGKTMKDGTTLTKDNVDEWIRPQLPPRGVPNGAQDAQVWNWQIDDSNPDAPLYLGAPEDKSSWPDNATAPDPDAIPGHPGLYVGDEPVGPQDRPKIMFNPTNGRPAFPLMRTQVGQRNPFAPNGHSGAPWLGETADKPKTGSGPDPWAQRPDGICPSGAPVRRFNVVALELPVPITRNANDPAARIFVLAHDVDDVLAGRKPAEPLAIRGNIGDCIAVTLTSRLTDETDFANFAKVNMHIHHVQFDTQASDGVISGMSFEQSIRPYRVEDPTLVNAANSGSRTLRLSSVAKFHPGSWIAVSQGTEDIEVRQIESIDAGASEVTLTQALGKDHSAGHHAGVEFTQYRWYPDVNLDNIFWHDHVDGIHSWGRGSVGQLIIEPEGSTYHDPSSGAVVDSGTYVDIHTDKAVARGQVEGSFRELALWTLDESSVTDSTLNLRAEPWADRLAADPDPSLLFSSWRHGDPVTPLPKAYRGDPFVIRTINVGPSQETLHVDGHRFRLENRFQDPNTGGPLATPIDTLHYGVSERYTAILEGGAGGGSQRPGDYLYMNGLGRRFRQGAWGILRVLPRQVAGLRPLPGTNVPSGGSIPARTGGRPPASTGPGDPCPGGARPRSFDVSAVDVSGGPAGAKTVYAPTARAAAVRSGSEPAEPLILHAAAGDCVTVNFKNELTPPPAGTVPAPPARRASFHVSKLDQDVNSSGIDVGFNPEQTVTIGQTKTYRFYADTAKIGSAPITDFGDPASGDDGLYGAIVVAPSGATFADPVTGAPKDVGAQVDVHADGRGYRDYTLLLADDDPVIGGSFMPYPTAVAGPSLVNYRTAPRQPGPAQFSSRVNGDPATPILRSYAGDPMKVHVVGAPGDEQVHSFNLGGMSWSVDPRIPDSNEITTGGVGPWETADIEVIGGAGGRGRTTGDYFYGDMRRAFTDAGMWGLARVMSDPSCPIKPLPGLSCTGQPSLVTDLPPKPFADPAAEKKADAPAGAAKADAQAPAGGGAPSARALRLLKAPKRITRSALRRKGLQLQLAAPATTRALRLRLFALRGGKKVRVGQHIATTPRGGRVRITWRPSAAILRRLRTGSYLLEVREGPRALKTNGAIATLRLRIAVP